MLACGGQRARRGLGSGRRLDGTVSNRPGQIYIFTVWVAAHRLAVRKNSSVRERPNMWSQHTPLKARRHATATGAGDFEIGMNHSHAALLRTRARAARGVS